MFGRLSNFNWRLQYLKAFGIVVLVFSKVVEMLTRVLAKALDAEQQKIGDKFITNIKLKVKENSKVLYIYKIQRERKREFFICLQV